MPLTFWRPGSVSGCCRIGPSATASAPSLPILNYASRTRVRNQRRTTTGVTGVVRRSPHGYAQRLSCYGECMTVRDMLAALQVLPRDAELLAFEAGW
jgi:hypothetical protein